MIEKGDVVSFKAGTQNYKGIFQGMWKKMYVVTRGIKRILVKEIW